MKAYRILHTKYTDINLLPINTFSIDDLLIWFTLIAFFYMRIMIKLIGFLVINFVKLTYIFYVLVEINYIELSLFWERLLKKLYM